MIAAPDASRLMTRLRPAPPRPTRYVDAEGTERLAGRRGVMRLNNRLCCPEGHRIRRTGHWLPETVHECQYRADKHAPPCGVLIYVLGDFTGADGTELMWAVEVTRAELRRMRLMTLPDRIEYLDMVVVGIG